MTSTCGTTVHITPSTTSQPKSARDGTTNCDGTTTKHRLTTTQRRGQLVEHQPLGRLVCASLPFITPNIEANSAEPRPSASPNGVGWSSTWSSSATPATTTAPIASSRAIDPAAKHERLDDRGEERDRRQRQHRGRDAGDLDRAVEAQPVDADDRADAGVAQRRPRGTRSGWPRSRTNTASTRDDDHEPVPDQRDRLDRDLAAEDRGAAPQQHDALEQRVRGGRDRFATTGASYVSDTGFRAPGRRALERTDRRSGPYPDARYRAR